MCWKVAGNYINIFFFSGNLNHFYPKALHYMVDPNLESWLLYSSAVVIVGVVVTVSRSIKQILFFLCFIIPVWNYSIKWHHSIELDNWLWSQRARTKKSNEGTEEAANKCKASLFGRYFLNLFMGMLCHFLLLYDNSIYRLNF